MSLALPAALSGLTDREGIRDALYRCVAGLDTDEAALFESAFTKDASLDFNGKTIEPYDEIKTQCFDLIAGLDTTHTVSNERVLHEAHQTTAKLTTTALTQHYHKGEGVKGDAPRLLSGGLWKMDLIKDQPTGLWKIQSWAIKSIWAEGDRNIVMKF